MVKKEKKQSTKKETKVDQKKIQELEDHVKELEASLLYSKAEAENARKRSLKDIEKARKFAVEKFCQEILLVKDSLDAALIVDKASLESYKDGIDLTSKQLLNIFAKFNIEEVNPVDEIFDPNFHQAMTMIESEGAPNRILNVCLLYTSPSPRDLRRSRMPSSA